MANQNSGAQRAEVEKTDSTTVELSPEAKKRLAEATQTKMATDESAGDTGYKVAPGKSLVTRRGIIDEGGAIGPLDCAPSPDKRDQGLLRLDELVKGGYVVKTK